MVIPLPAKAQNQNQNQNQNVCTSTDANIQLCDDGFFVPQNFQYTYTDSTGSQITKKSDEKAVEIANYACTLANQVSGREYTDPTNPQGAKLSSTCWICTITDITAQSMNLLVSLVPAKLACKNPTLVRESNGNEYYECGQGGYSLLFVLFLTIAGAISLWGLVGTLLKTSLPILEYTYLARVAIAMTLVWALAEGWVQDLWRLTLGILNIGSNFGSWIRKNTSGDTLEWSCSSEAHGWDNLAGGIHGQMQAAVEMLAAILAMSWPLMPDFDIIGQAIEAVTSVGSSVIVQILRVVMVVAIVSAAASTVLIFMLAIVEGLIYSGFVLAISPVIVFMSIFKPTRSVLPQSFAAIGHGFMALAVVGISIAIATAVLTLTVFAMTGIALDPEYLSALTADERAYVAAVEAKCDPKFAGMPKPWSEVGRYLCYYASNTSDITVTTTWGHSHAWLVPALFLLIGSVIARAMAKFVQAFAQQFSGFAAENVAQGVAQNVQGLAQTGVRGIGRLGGALR